MNRKSCSRPLRVLNVLLDNRFGGLQVRVLESAPLLLAQNIQTIILLPNNPGNTYQLAVMRGLEVRRIKYHYPHKFKTLKSLLDNTLWIYTFVPSILAMVNLIYKERIDVVQVNGLMGFQAAIAAKITKRRLVWFLIGNVYPRWMIRILMPFVVRLADKIVLISNKMKEYYLLQNVNPTKEGKIRIIHEFVNYEKITSVSEEEQKRIQNELRLDKNDFIVISVGNVNPAKGYEYLIEAATLIKKVHENVCFIIAGARFPEQAFYWKRLDELVEKNNLKDNVKFLGLRNDIPVLLSISHVFCLPSINEGTPIAILEAMAAGLPVVATDVGGISEQVIHGKTGFLVQPANPERLAGALLNLLNDRELRNRLGKAGKERVMTVFCPEVFVEKHVALYRSMIHFK